jgi:hypothetical protein
LKLAAPAAPAPAEPISEPADDAGFGDFGGDEEPAAEPKDDKPFDDEPFDAGVEANEEEDPKKFIEQLTGKLGQSLRKYTEEQGQPDFDLEKFAINSLLSATHTSEMDEEDKNDIIKKVNTAGNNDSEDSDMGNDDNNSNDGNDNDNGSGGSSDNDAEFGDESGEADLEEYVIYENENLFLDEPKKNNMFQPGSNNALKESCWKGYKQVGMKDKGGKQVPNCVPVNENHEGHEGHESLNYMFWQNLKTIHHATGELLEMNQEQIDEMCANGHAWAVDHIASSADDVEEVYHFFESNIEDDSMDYDGETEGGYEDEYGTVEGGELYEGKYDGKPLGKPMKGDVKKFKVYVKNKKGNVVKVNFGDPNMEIKRDNPERRKSFRARHKCAQAKDRTTPKYWSCKMWSKTPVSKMVAESLDNSKKSSTFDKNFLKKKLNETFNQDDMNNAEPQTAPAPVKTPVVKPGEAKPVQPSRKNKPFLPMPSVQPDPKAVQIYHNTFSSAVQTASEYANKLGYELNEDEWFTKVATGPKKPSEGETNRYSLSLYKDGKEQRKMLHFQVYGMKNKYELNAYIN